MFLNNLSIARRLALVLAAMLALSLVTSLFAFLTLRNLGTEVSGLVGDNLKVERAAADWVRYASEGTDRSSAIARSSDPSLGDYFADSTAQLTILATARQKIVEDQIVDSFRLCIDPDTRVEIRWARFDQHDQRVRVGLCGTRKESQ